MLPQLQDVVTAAGCCHSCRMLPQLQDVVTAAGCRHSCRMLPQLQDVDTAAGCCHSCSLLPQLQDVARAAGCCQICRMLPSVQDVAAAAGCCHSCSMSSIAAGCRHSCRHSPGGSRRRSVQFASGCGPRPLSALATIGPAQRPTRRHLQGTNFSVTMCDAKSTVTDDFVQLCYDMTRLLVCKT